MKKLIILLFMAVASVAASAQTYVGALAGVSSYKLDCEGSSICDKSNGAAIKVYFGSRFDNGDSIHLGSSVAVDAVEFGLVSFGRAKNVGSRVFQTLDSLGNVVDIVGNVESVIRARAITASIVGRWQVAGPAALLVRLGGAYVTASADEKIDGVVANGSAVGSKLKPYVGLGFEYDVVGILKLAAGVDVTQYDTGASKGTLSAFGLGVQKDF